MTEHTPTPWKIGTPKVEWSVNPEKSYGSSSHLSIVAKGRADPICIMVQADKRGYYGSGDAQLDANAALLLEAVNSHAGLLAKVSALTEALEAILSPDVETMEDGCVALEKAHAALDFAKDPS